MGKTTKFRPCLIKTPQDRHGRSMSITSAISDDLKNISYKEELLVQVEDSEQKSMMMWAWEDFEDKLDMMRTAFTM